MLSILDTSPLKCIPIKRSFNYNLYSAMGGYDIGRANPQDPFGDPAIRSRIFSHDCPNGYYSFISDVRDDLHCQAEFSSKSITSLSEYVEHRGSSNKFSAGGSVSAG